MGDSSDEECKAGDAMLTDSEPAPKPSAHMQPSALDLSTPPQMSPPLPLPYDYYANTDSIC